MDDLLEIFCKSEAADQRLEAINREFFEQLRCHLWGPTTAAAPGLPLAAPCAPALSMAQQQQLLQPPSPSPRQTEKRKKCLPSLNEDEELSNTIDDVASSMQRLSTRASNSKLLEVATAMHVEEEEEVALAEVEDHRQSVPSSLSKSKTEFNEHKEEEAPKQLMDVVMVTKEEQHQQQLLMPPPPIAAPANKANETSTFASDHSFARPQRAAKLKSEKNLKEPKLNAKMRRPSNSEKSLIKLEHEQRPSQMHESLSSTSSMSSSQPSSARSEDSVIVVPGKAPSVVEVPSDEEEDEQRNLQSAASSNLSAEVNDDDKKKTKKSKKNKKLTNYSVEKSADELCNETRQLRIVIKREKSSLNLEERRRSQEATGAEAVMTTEPLPMETHASDQSTLASTILSSSATTILSASTATNVTTVAAANKKGGARKKKPVVVKPIKVERFSDIPMASPISSRTRKGSVGRDSHKEAPPPILTATTRAASIYEDAVDNLETEGVETPPTRLSQVPKSVAAAAAGAAINETVTFGSAKPQDATVVLGGAPGDATFCTASNMTVAQSTFVMTDNNQNPNATVTLPQKMSNGGGDCDATFNVPLVAAAVAKQQMPIKSQRSHSSTRNSMETAKDTTPSPPPATHDDSLITDDESFERPSAPIKAEKQKLPVPKALPAAAKLNAMSKLPSSAKAYKMPMPSRTNELFNPLVQSPVKKKVQAFENAVTAHAATEEQHTKTGRPKRTKENAAPTAIQSSSVTPIIGKIHHLPAPALGRFLTPTQASNITTPNALTTALAKKGPNSASKAIPFPKSASSSNIGASSTTNLKASHSTSGKTLSRENSGAEDFRKGLHQIAEDRKKQREQKHLLAAQQREVKERERAERIAKLAKEREEKRLKKQQEADIKRREMEEINRRLRQQEEAAEAAKQKAAAAAKLKAAAAAAAMQDLETKAGGGASAKSSRMMPPPPKNVQSKYTFEMLHEDDSTDDEEKTSYKRPPAPTWSRSHVRGPAIAMQQYGPHTSIIDSFFSVQPMTPDLKLIFPNIDPRHLRRNSSVLWSTPPRYSELPKY